MSKGNLNTEGGKKTNFPFQFNNLRLLGEISSTLAAAIPPPGAGLATEATLISVLNAIIASDQDLEILLVRDKGNGDLVVQQITNWETGTPVITYKDVNGNPYVPVGPLEYLDPSAVLNLILTEIQAQSTQLTNIINELTAANVSLNNIDNELIDQGNTLDTIDADTSTLATPTTSVATSMTRVTSAGAASVAAGKRRVSFFNAGNADSTVDGATLKKGEVVTFSADGLRDTLEEITYDALTSELLITTVG